MDLKKLAPWNWFKREEEPGSDVPVRHTQPSALKGRDIRDPFKAIGDLGRMLESGLKGWSPLDFDSLLTPLSASSLLRPQVDIGASADEYTISVEIPGVTEKDIALEVLGDSLMIKGEKRQEQESRDKSYYRVERSYGSFQRVLSLPEDAEHDRISAVFKNGVLTVSIPRCKTASAQVKTIEIKALE
jgi:HSP20 family protein